MNFASVIRFIPIVLTFAVKPGGFPVTKHQYQALQLLLVRLSEWSRSA